MSKVPIAAAFRRPEDVSQEYLCALGNTKRFIELSQLKPHFIEEMRQNPRATVSRYGLNIDAEEFRLLWDPEVRGEWTRLQKAGEPLPELPPALQRFGAFLREKKDFAKEWMDHSDPSDPRMAAWRSRQMARVSSELYPARARRIVHAPVAIELAVGCSVGCWFCSVAAERLSKKAVYAEIKHLWQEVLHVLREPIGNAARWGFCYWATDPLDNPDYEKFCGDFADALGRFPQTTTAIAWRDTERTRALLKLSRTKGCELNRFSILTLGILEKIYAAFRPEELIHVELLPLNREAGIPKTFAGRARQGKPPEGQTTFGAEDASTTSCVSGFLLNMVERTVRLITPCNASERWPFGHWLLEQAVFRDADDLRRAMQRMMDTYMPINIMPDTPVRLRQDLRWKVNGDPSQACISSRFVDHNITGMPGLKDVAWEVAHRPSSAEQVARTLEQEKDMPMENTLFLLNSLFKRGLLNEEPCQNNCERQN